MFSREDTKALKGVGILLMLFHHLAAFPDRVPVGFEGFAGRIFGGQMLQQMAGAAQMCVGIFFFLGGYGLYKRGERGSFGLLDSILSLFRRYWKVFVLFIPVAFIFFSRSGEGLSELSRLYVITSRKVFITALVSNFFGLSFTFNREWWCFIAYIAVLPLGCVFCMATRKRRGFVPDMLIVAAVYLIYNYLLPNLTNTQAFSGIGTSFVFLKLSSASSRSMPAIFFAGAVFARYDMLAALKRRLAKLRFGALVGALGFAAVFVCRTCSVGAEGDIFYVPLAVLFASVALDGMPHIKKVLGFFGKHSMNMWLEHTFFCYYFLEATQLVYITRNVFVDYAILVALSLGSSILIELFYGGISKLWERVRTARLPSAAGAAK